MNGLNRPRVTGIPVGGHPTSEGSHLDRWNCSTCRKLGLVFDATHTSRSDVSLEASYIRTLEDVASNLSPSHRDVFHCKTRLRHTLVLQARANGALVPATIFPRLSRRLCLHNPFSNPTLHSTTSISHSSLKMSASWLSSLMGSVTSSARRRDYERFWDSRDEEDWYVAPNTAK